MFTKLIVTIIMIYIYDPRVLKQEKMNMMMMRMTKMT